MKKLNKKEGIIYFNRFTGAYGHQIYLPDNVDLLEWVELPESEVRKYEHDASKIYEKTKELINEQLQGITECIPMLLDSKSRIQTYNLEITIKDVEINEKDYGELYTATKLLKNNNINLFGEYLGIKDIIEEELNNYNNNINYISNSQNKSFDVDI